MGATLHRGKTFDANEQVTHTKLHQLIDDGTVADADETNLASARGLIVRSTSAPSNTNCIWVDTNCSPPVAKTYDGAEWIPNGSFAVMTNKSGGTRSAGDVVIVDAANAGGFTTTTSAGSTAMPMIVMQSIANNADGVVALPGARVTNIAVDGTTAVGDHLKTSTSAGKATPTTFGAGTFAIALASRSGAGAIAEALIYGIGSAYTPTAANALSGSVVQMVNSQDGAVATGTTAIPNDDTIPQNTEGTQFLSKAITPTNASNLLKIEVVVNVTASGGTPILIGALFQDSTAGALNAVKADTAGGNGLLQLTIVHWMVAGTTSATTFKVRVGDPAGGTVTLNGEAAARKFGGVCISSITITEIKA